MSCLNSSQQQSDETFLFVSSTQKLFSHAFTDTQFA